MVPLFQQHVVQIIRRQKESKGVFQRAMSHAPSVRVDDSGGSGGPKDDTLGDTGGLDVVS